MKNLNLLFVLALLSLSGFSQTAEPKDLIPLDPLVRTGRLSNGFTYYIRRNTTPEKKVVLYLVNKVGSILETDEQRGLAHFMEHMSFNGTLHFPKSELVNYLQKIGVSFGADLNAYTGFDETVYQLPLPSDDIGILKNGIQIMRDWASDASLDLEEINKERGVVLEERRLRLGAGQRVQDHFRNLIFNGSRYANRLPIGTEDVLKNFKPETLRSFYKDWYRPDLQAIIAVGDVNVEEMERMIKAKFSDIKNPVKEKKRLVYNIPLTGKNHFISITDAELTATSVQVMIKQKAEALQTISNYRRRIIQSLFNQVLAKRLRESSLRPDASFLQCSAGVSEFLGGLDNFTVNLTVKPGKSALENAFKSVWREIMSVKKMGFTIGELRAVKHNYQETMEAMFKEKDKTSSDQYVKEYVAHFTKGIASPGIDYEIALLKKTLPGISLEEVNAAAAVYIKDTDRDIFISAPEKEKQNLPVEQTVTGWIREVGAEDFQPYAESAHTTSLLSKLPLGGKIVSENKDRSAQVTTLKLSNGIKIVLKPTSFKNNEILFSGTSSGGTSVYPKEDYFSAVNAVPMVTSFGIGNYSMADLQYFLSDKQLSVQPFMDERTQGVNGATVPKDLETALQLTYAYFTGPRKDSLKFERTMTQVRENISARYNDPDNVFRDTIAAVMGNYDIRRTAPSLDKLNQVKLGRVYDIYKERFSATADLTFTFVGSFDIDSIKPLLIRYLGSLPSATSVTEAHDTGIRIPEGKIFKTVHKGTAEKANVQLIFSGMFTYSIENNLDLEALKKAMEIRMIERLREEEGGVYTPSVQLKSAKYTQGNYAFGISFGCSPSNVEKLVNAVLDEINTLRTAGPLQVNVDKLIATERVRQKNVKATNGWWISHLNDCVENEADFNSMDDYQEKLSKVNVESIKKAANQYLSGKNCLKFVLLPVITSK